MTPALISGERLEPLSPAVAVETEAATGGKTTESLETFTAGAGEGPKEEEAPLGAAVEEWEPAASPGLGGTG